MSRRVNKVVDMEVDEISLVDVPAAADAQVLIAKRATEEDQVPEIFDEQGQPVDPDSLALGQQVYDATGQLYEVVADEGDDDGNGDEDQDEELLDDESLELVGKRFTESLRTQLSKSFTDIERDEVIAKAAGRVAEAEARAIRAERIAKSEQTIRLEREYVEVAKGYNIPANPDELGPVLMRMAESMSDADCRVIHKALTGAGSTIFEEIGFIGGGDNVDPMAAAQAAVETAIAKSGASVSKEEALTEYFLAHPEAYDDYLRETAGRS